jgi:hypothetical protein
MASLENPADIGRPANTGGAASNAALGSREVTTINAGADVNPSTRPIMPDIAFSGAYTDSWGDVWAGGVVRQFSVDNGLPNSSGVFSQESTVGYGGGVGATFNLSSVGASGSFAKDQIGLKGYFGSGIGHYLIGPEQGVGQGTFARFNGTGVKVFTTGAYGGQIWGLHYWTDQLRTNVVYGISEYHLPVYGTGYTFNTANSWRQQSAYINLIWSPVKSVNIGLEFMWGQRNEQANPATGHRADPSAERLQASLQYVF